eukprot:7376256-Prymnesium_polylepis.1
MYSACHMLHASSAQCRDAFISATRESACACAGTECAALSPAEVLPPLPVRDHAQRPCAQALRRRAL